MQHSVYNVDSVQSGNKIACADSAVAVMTRHLLRCLRTGLWPLQKQHFWQLSYQRG